MRTPFIFIATLILLVFINQASAKTDLVVSVSDIAFSEEEPLEGDTVRIFARIFNVGDVDVYGFVVFLKNGQELAAPQPISVKVNTYDDVFIDWVADGGDFDIEAKLINTIPPDDNSDNDRATKENYFVDFDTDKDGTGNARDLDDDNDGLSDEEEGNLKTNPLEPDTDKDGVNDKTDVFPSNPTESKDVDNDGFGDNADLDDDNDGLGDAKEKTIGTNPFSRDTDKDGVGDRDDVFPLNSAEWADNDHDGIGNNRDGDDDNDGVTDEQELFVFKTDPLNSRSKPQDLSQKKETAPETVFEEGEKKEEAPAPTGHFSLASLITSLRNFFDNIDTSKNKIPFIVGLILVSVLIFFFFRRRRYNKLIK